MRRWRVVGLLALLMVLVSPAVPAQAGGWAVTLLDPLPSKFEAGRAYTVGYWVLQHGAHPPEGELGKTGLRLVGSGKVLEFEGAALREPAHYAVAIAVPAGSWRVYAMQGWFQEFEVGTLTVPGGLAFTPSEMEIAVGGHSDGGEPPHWGAVHPPSGVMDGHDGKVQQVVGQAAPKPAAVDTPAPSEPVPTALVVVGGLGALVVAGLATGPLRRRLGG